jgi:XRE family transcriptional regulator, regulator of sulfur utilization
MPFADRLKALRAAADLSQAELARRSGMHLMGISKLETGNRQPTWETVQALADALGVEVAAFLDDKPKKGKKK